MAPAIANTIESKRSFENDIPVFDLSVFPQQLEEGCTKGLESLFVNVGKACEEWGCFLVVNHGIGQDLLQKLDMASREPFTLPKQTKERNVSETPYYGYIGPCPMVPFYESLGIPGAPRPEAIQRLAEQLWPLQGNPSFCETIQTYSNKMAELADNIHKIILASLGVIKYYGSHFSNCQGVLRLNHFAVSGESSVLDGLATHTDGGSIAILYQDDMGGLEVLNQAGEWVTVKPLPNSLVVVIGDTLQAWSNWRCRAAKYRVMVKEWKNRLSVPFFWVFPDDMEISAPSELVDDRHPRCHRPFTYLELCDFRAGPIGKIWHDLATLPEAPCPVDVFAGIKTQQ